MYKLTLVCLLAAAALVSCRPEEQYTDRYDNIDLDEILSNKRLLIPYIKCLLEQGKCSPEGKELKIHIRDALENDCLKCTEKQRSSTDKVIGHLINHEEAYWKELSAKYDPEAKYVVKYEDRLTKVKASA